MAAPALSEVSRLAPFGVPVVPDVRMTVRDRALGFAGLAAEPFLDELVNGDDAFRCLRVDPRQIARRVDCR